MLSPTYEIATALSHTDELISPPYDIAIVTISYGRVTMSSVWDSMMSKKNMGWPFYAAVLSCWFIYEIITVETCRGPDYGPLARYVKLWVAHAPGMPPQVSDPDMHHGTCVTHVPVCMPGSLASSFLWSRWRGKRSRHSQRMRNPQFYSTGKRPIEVANVYIVMDWFVCFLRM